MNKFKYLLYTLSLSLLATTAIRAMDSDSEEVDPTAFGDACAALITGLTGLFSSNTVENQAGSSKSSFVSIPRLKVENTPSSVTDYMDNETETSITRIVQFAEEAKILDKTGHPVVNQTKSNWEKVGESSSGLPNLFSDTFGIVGNSLTEFYAKFNHFSRKVADFATSTGSIISDPKKVALGIFILVVLYYTAKPLGKRVANGAVDLVGYSAKGLYKGAAFTGGKLKAILNYIFKSKISFFQRVLGKKLILNSDAQAKLDSFALIDKTVTHASISGDNNVKFKNLLLSGSDYFVKTEYCKELAKATGKELLIIDSKSPLFRSDIKTIFQNNDTNIEYDPVFAYFETLNQSTKPSLVVFDLENLNLNSNNSEAQKVKNIVIDILGHAKFRSNKYNFIFIIKKLDDQNLLEHLDGLFDEHVEIQKPNKIARRRIIQELITKLILNKRKPLLPFTISFKKSLLPIRISLNSYSEKTKYDDVTLDKQSSFRKYLTEVKLNWIVDSLEGKNYQDIQMFVVYLKTLLYQDSIEVSDNYDQVINILLGKEVRLNDQFVLGL